MCEGRSVTLGDMSAVKSLFAKSSDDNPTDEVCICLPTVLGKRIYVD